MVRKMLRKNLNLVRHHGILGLLPIYLKTLEWYSRRILSSGAAKYKKVKVNDYSMYIDLKDSGISKALFIYGSREKDQMYIIENNMRRGAKVLDIGANIGYYVILESLLISPSAKIVAYEPSAENCLLLKKNIDLNDLADRVEANNAAVSNRSGVSKFYLSDKSNLHTLNPAHFRGAGEKTAPEPVDVATVNIYEILAKHRDVGFIRMDIEGHEVEVLDGLAKAAVDLGIYPDVLFETHLRKYDPSHHDIREKLESLFKIGYFPKTIASGDERTSGLRQRGYTPDVIISTDRVDRGIYEGVSKSDALDLICDKGGVRAVFLRKN